MECSIRDPMMYSLRITGMYVSMQCFFICWHRCVIWKSGELVHVIADAHIYDRHIPLVEELIKREPLPAPKFWLNPEVKNFYDFTPDDVKLIDYETHEQIKNIPVAV